MRVARAGVSVMILAGVIASVTPAEASASPVSDLTQKTLQLAGLAPTITLTQPGAAVDASLTSAFVVSGTVKGLTAPFVVQIKWGDTAVEPVSVAKSGGSFRAEVMVEPGTAAVTRSLRVTATGSNGLVSEISRAVTVMPPSPTATIAQPGVVVAEGTTSPITVDMAARTAVLPASASVRVGNVIVAGETPGTPFGWAGRITSITSGAGGTLLVSWSQAALTDIFRQATITVGIDTNPETGEHQQTSPPQAGGIPAQPANGGGGGGMVLGKVFENPFSGSTEVEDHEGSYDRTFSKDVTASLSRCGVAAPKCVTGSLTASVGAAVHVDWYVRIETVCVPPADIFTGERCSSSVREAKADLRVSDAYFEAALDITGEDSFDKTIPMLKNVGMKRPAVVPVPVPGVGAVPVTVRVVADLDAKVAAKISGAIHAEIAIPVVDFAATGRCARSEPDDGAMRCNGSRHTNDVFRGANWNAGLNGSISASVGGALTITVKNYELIESAKIGGDVSGLEATFTEERTVNDIPQGGFVLRSGLDLFADFPGLPKISFPTRLQKDWINKNPWPEVLTQPNAPDLRETSNKQLEVSWPAVPGANKYVVERKNPGERTVTTLTSVRPPSDATTITAVVDAIDGENTLAFTAFGKDARTPRSKWATSTVEIDNPPPSPGNIDTVVGGSQRGTSVEDLALNSPQFAKGPDGYFVQAGYTIMYVTDGRAYPVAGNGGAANPDQLDGPADSVGFYSMAGMQWDPWAQSSIPTVGGPTIAGALIVSDRSQAVRRVENGAVTVIARTPDPGYGYAPNAFGDEVAVAEDAYYVLREWYSGDPAGGVRVVRIDRQTGAQSLLFDREVSGAAEYIPGPRLINSLAYDYVTNRLLVAVTGAGWTGHPVIIPVDKDGNFEPRIRFGDIDNEGMMRFQLGSTPPQGTGTASPVVAIEHSGKMLRVVDETLTADESRIPDEDTRFGLSIGACTASADSVGELSYVIRLSPCGTTGNTIGDPNPGGRPTTARDVRVSNRTMPGRFDVDPSNGDLYVADAGHNVLKISPSGAVTTIVRALWPYESRRAEEGDSFAVGEQPVNFGEVLGLSFDRSDSSLWVSTNRGHWHIKNGTGRFVSALALGSGSAVAVGDGTAVVGNVYHLYVIDRAGGVVRDRVNTLEDDDDGCRGPLLPFNATSGQVYGTWIGGGQLCVLDDSNHFRSTGVVVPGQAVDVTSTAVYYLDNNSNRNSPVLYSMPRTGPATARVRIAGNGTNPPVTGDEWGVGTGFGTSGDDVSALNTTLDTVGSVRATRSGEVLLSVAGHNRIRRVTPAP